MEQNSGALKTINSFCQKYKMNEQRKSYEFSDVRQCAHCSYSTRHRGRWSTHQKTCKNRPGDDADRALLHERIASLEQQLIKKDEQLTATLARNAALEHLLGEQLSEVKEELRKTKKRKDRYADVATARRKLGEPARRQIAQGQMWKCAGEACVLAGDLQEYDIDHVIPLWRGGIDEPANMQALCPACHRRKTNQERLERSQGTPPLQVSEVQGSGGD